MVRPQLVSLLEGFSAGCQATGKDVAAFVPSSIHNYLQTAHDTALTNAICTFLTNNKNWEAIKSLDFAKFEGDRTQGGGLRLSDPDVIVDVAGLLAALSAHPKEFCASWKGLIEVCHCVLPAERHFSEQLNYLCSGAADRQVVGPGAPATGGLDDLLSGLVGNGDLVNSLLSGDINQIDATKIVNSVHRAVEPLIDRLEEGSTKQGIQMIVRGLMSLAQQQQQPVDSSGGTVQQ